MGESNTCASRRGETGSPVFIVETGVMRSMNLSLLSDIKLTGGMEIDV